MKKDKKKINLLDRLRNRKIGVLIICLFIAFVTLLICSKCSFLYPFNGWDDFNSFYTVGRGWANGLIPYRDLFEQKGPFLYLIFMIGYLISPLKFTGVFVLEVIFFTLTLYFSSKIIDLFLSDREEKKGKYLILFLYAIIMTTSISFVEGCSSEEFNLLFVTITVFYILKYLKNDELVNMSYKDLTINGLCCGLSLMIKYTTIGLWFIVMAYICLKLFKLGRYKEGILKGLVFILAMLIPFGFFAIYFYINEALFDFLNTYFYINIFKYSETSNIFINLLISFINIVMATFSNVFLYIFMYIIFAYYFLKKRLYKYNFKLKNYQKIFFIISFFSLIILYYGQEFRMYIIISMYYLVLLIIIWIYKLFYKYRAFKWLCGVFILGLLIFGFDYEYMNTDKEDVIQYRFANIINQYDNPTLLQYRSIDEGFYTAARIMPENKYFEQVNIGISELPESYEEQDYIIKNKKVMFVVVRKCNLEKEDTFPYLYTNRNITSDTSTDLDFLSTYYELVDKYENNVGYYEKCTYYLYKDKS